MYLCCGFVVSWFCVAAFHSAPTLPISLMSSTQSSCLLMDPLQTSKLLLQKHTMTSSFLSQLSPASWCDGVNKAPFFPGTEMLFFCLLTWFKSRINKYLLYSRWVSPVVGSEEEEEGAGSGAFAENFKNFPPNVYICWGTLSIRV